MTHIRRSASATGLAAYLVALGWMRRAHTPALMVVLLLPIPLLRVITLLLISLSVKGVDARTRPIARVGRVWLWRTVSLGWLRIVLIVATVEGLLLRVLGVWGVLTLAWVHGWTRPQNLFDSLQPA